MKNIINLINGIKLTLNRLVKEKYQNYNETSKQCALTNDIVSIVEQINFDCIIDEMIDLILELGEYDIQMLINDINACRSAFYPSSYYSQYHVAGLLFDKNDLINYIKRLNTSKLYFLINPLHSIIPFFGKTKSGYSFYVKLDEKLRKTLKEQCDILEHIHVISRLT